MPTLLMRLSGPMQSWGTRSRFDERDTDMEPSKSGVIGLACAALGRDRSDDVSDLAALRMGVRVDRQGVLRSDYQTATDLRLADGKRAERRTVVSRRYYLAGAVFLVGLEGATRGLLDTVHAALRAPHWQLSLGRKSYVPGESVWLPDGVVASPLEEALAACPPLVEEGPATYRYVVESDAGVTRMDQPVAPFSERRFGSRHVQSVEYPAGDTPNISAEGSV